MEKILIKPVPCRRRSYDIATHAPSGMIEASYNLSLCKLFEETDLADFEIMEIVFMQVGDTVITTDGIRVTRHLDSFR